MSQNERTGTRDLTESRWHRSDSLARFMSKQEAESCGRIDIDCVWFGSRTYEPVALIETARDDGNQNDKCASVTRNLARMCNPIVHAFIVLYKISEHKNPVDPKYNDIEMFRVKQIWPFNWYEFRTYSPEQHAKFILNFHRFYDYYRTIHALVVESKLFWQPPGPYWENGIHDEYNKMIDNTDYYLMTEDQLTRKAATIKSWLEQWKSPLKLVS
jgi:hypothetical protein